MEYSLWPTVDSAVDSITVLSYSQTSDYQHLICSTLQLFLVKNQPTDKDLMTNM